MADVVENTNDDGAAAEAEPAECSRLMFTCLLGGAAAALFYVFALVLDLPTRSTAVGVAQVALLLLAVYSGCWFLFFFMLPVVEWCLSNPEGRRAVDIFLQSDRPFLQESFHQFMLRA